MRKLAECSAADAAGNGSRKLMDKKRDNSIVVGVVCLLLCVAVICGLMLFANYVAEYPVFKLEMFNS